MESDAQKKADEGFNKLPIEDKVTLLRMMLKDTNAKNIDLQVQVEMLTEKKNMFNELFVSDMDNKAQIEALREALETFISLNFASDYKTFQQSLNFAYKEKFRAKISASRFLSQEQKDVLLKQLKP